MNQAPVFNRKPILFSLIFIITLLLLSGAMGIYILTDKSVEQAMTMMTAAMQIDEHYYNDIDRNRLISSAREEMFSKLDRYSGYYQEKRFEQMDDNLSGSYTGIGISIIRHEQGLLIMSVREDGPAYLANLFSGDIITVVDSTSIAGFKSRDAIDLLKGETDTEVIITILRPSNEMSFEVTLKRKRLDFIHIPFAGLTDDSLIYIRLLDFDGGASEDLEDALDSLITNSPIRPKGLILDLRNNPGGFFYEGYQIANLFLDEGIFIVGTDGRSRWKEREHYATGEDITGNLPMAVIVNRGSASAAEIVSGALRQANRAVLVGDTTFGKGLVQGFVHFPNGDGIKLTISRYYFEGNIYLNEFDSTLIDTGHGLTPDYYYDEIVNNYFVTELENSLILQDFSIKYQDEIIDAVKNNYFDNVWIDKLIKYVDKKDKSINSKRTNAAELMKSVSLDEQSSPATLKTINKIISLSNRLDKSKFYKNADYIKYRLSRFAFQRKYGTYQMYKDIIVNQQPVIKLAAEVLLKNR